MHVYYMILSKDIYGQVMITAWIKCEIPYNDNEPLIFSHCLNSIRRCLNCIWASLLALEMCKIHASVSKTWIYVAIAS